MIPKGTPVFLHQAFRCCPYAGMISSQLHDYLEQNGYVLAERPQDAKIQLLNTCGSDASQAALTWHTLEAIRREAPESTVVLTGCLVAIEPKATLEALATFPRSARFDPRHLPQIDEFFSPEVIAFGEVQPALHNVYSGNDFSEGWTHILASTGCLGSCSFCAIRRATGRPKSRSIDTIFKEVARSEEAGSRDILLVSTDMSAWGSDLGLTVVDLLAALQTAPGEFLWSVESFEPTLFLHYFEELLPLLASGRCAFIGLPLQSANSRVLRQMQRVYDPEAVLAAVQRLKAEAPEILIRTDFIYGFGEETEEEFEASIQASRHFDLPSFNAYQPRPGTAPLLLPPEVLQKRRDRALAELYTRAQAGIPRLRRASGPSGMRPAPAAPSGPWDHPEGRQWLSELGQRLGTVLEKGRISLGGGWCWEEVRVEGDAVILKLGAPGSSAELGMRHPDWPGEHLEKSRYFSIWVRGESVDPSPDRDRAIRRLIQALLRDAER